MFEFINHDKIAFVSARASPNFSYFPLQVNHFPLDIMLVRDPKNIFYYQHDIQNCTDQALDFELFDRHEYTHTEFAGL